MHAIIAAQAPAAPVTVPMLHLQVLDRETLQALDDTYRLYDVELSDEALLRTAHAELLLAQGSGLRVLGSSAPVSDDTPATVDEFVLGVAA